MFVKLCEDACALFPMPPLCLTVTGISNVYELKHTPVGNGGVYLEVGMDTVALGEGQV